MHDVPYGYCHCGCGQLTKPAKDSNATLGRVKGEPNRYLLGHANRGKDPSPRFWTKVDKGGPGGCWIWTSAQDKGYGIFQIAGRTVKAHRFAYEALVGPIPDGLQLDHLCRNRACVNPAHLEPVTNRENALRGMSLNAQNARKTHCKHGHPLGDDNVRLTPKGHRRCRICERAAGAVARAKRRAA